MRHLCATDNGDYRRWPGWVLSCPFRFRGLTSPTLRAAEVRPLLLHKTAPTQAKKQELKIQDQDIEEGGTLARIAVRMEQA